MYSANGALAIKLMRRPDNGRPMPRITTLSLINECDLFNDGCSLHLMPFHSANDYFEYWRNVDDASRHYLYAFMSALDDVMSF